MLTAIMMLTCAMRSAQQASCLGRRTSSTEADVEQVVHDPDPCPLNRSTGPSARPLLDVCAPKTTRRDSSAGGRRRVWKTLALWWQTSRKCWRRVADVAAILGEGGCVLQFDQRLLLADQLTCSFLSCSAGQLTCTQLVHLPNSRECIGQNGFAEECCACCMFVFEAHAVQPTCSLVSRMSGITGPDGAILHPVALQKIFSDVMSVLRMEMDVKDSEMFVSSWGHCCRHHSSVPPCRSSWKLWMRHAASPGDASCQISESAAH